MSTIARLTTIHIENFKRHKDLKIEFAAGLNVIRGPNYSGKSSVLEAILFALGGSTTVPGGRSVIVRTGAKECSVTLDFVTEDSMKWSVCRSSKDAVLHCTAEDGAGSTKATGHTAVNAEIEVILGIALKDWLVLSTSRQSETAALMTLGVTKLNQMIEQISEADFIDRVAKRAGVHQTKAQTQLEALPAPIDMVALGAEISASKVLLVDLEDAKSVLLDEKQENEKKLSECKKSLAEATEQNEKYRRAHYQKDLRQAKVDDLQQRLTASESKLAQEKVEDYSVISSLKEKYAEMQQATANALAINKKIADLDASIISKSAWIDGAGRNTLNAYRENAPKLAVLKETLDTVVAKRNTAIANQDHAKTELTAAQKAVEQSVCPTCKRAMGEGQHEHAAVALLERKQTYLNATALANECITIVSELNAEYKTIVAATPSSDIVVVYDLRATELLQHKEQRESLVLTSNGNIIEQEITAKELQENIARLEQSKWAFEAATKAVAATTTELNEQRAILQELLSDLSGLTQANTLPLERARDDLQARAVSISQLLHENSVKYIAVDHEVRSLLSKELTATLTEQTRKNLEGQAGGFGGLRKYLRDNKAAFMSDMWEQLMALTSEFVGQVTEGDVTAIGRDNDGDFWLEEDGERRPILAASGGQRAISGVGLRLALPSLLPTGSRLILLDEPSAELSDSTAAALAGALKAQDRQIILVTHREGEEFVSDSTITLERL